MRLSQLDNSDQNILIGNTASERKKSIIFNEGSNDQDFTVGTSINGFATIENAVNVKTLER